MTGSLAIKLPCLLNEDLHWIKIMKNVQKNTSTSSLDVKPLPLEEGLSLLKNMKPPKKMREEKLNLALEPYRAELLKASKNGNSKTALIEIIFRITKSRITYKKLDEILADSTGQQEVAK